MRAVTVDVIIFRNCLRCKGRPFCYFGFLEKATRPTNMARRRVVTLPYSEL